MTTYPLKFIIEEALEAHRLGKPGKFRAMLRLGLSQSESPKRALRREHSARGGDYTHDHLPGAQRASQGSVRA